MTGAIVGSSVLIVVIAALRPLLRRRVSARVVYALWALVLLRLLLPFSIELGAPSAEAAVRTVYERAEPAVQAVPAQAAPAAPDIDFTGVQTDKPSVSAPVQAGTVTEAEAETETGAAAARPAGEYLKLAWVCGSLAALLLFAGINLSFYLRLRRSRRPTGKSEAGLRVFECGAVASPCLFGLFRPEETTFTEETALLTAESNEIGVFGFFNVPYGHWIVRELKPAPAFVLNETLYPVTISEQEETIEITAENRYITGAVQTTKVDAAYPGNKLSGAVFEVYVDVDGNREFDAAIDRPAGKLAETEPGIYRLDGLRYNGYFLHEAASPEGFLPDEGYYYFEIREDGKTVIVETEAGVGFLNQPVLGNIRILKKDADTGEPLSGVVIGLFDMDGNEVARGVTKSGELLFEGIRYGCYELRELEAKDGYYLLKEPVPVEISEHGQTLTVELTNHKIPEIPQTGDSGTAAGVCLALFGVAGIALALTGRRRRRHS